MSVIPNLSGPPVDWLIDATDHRQFKAAGPNAAIREFPPGIRTSR